MSITYTTWTDFGTEAGPPARATVQYLVTVVLNFRVVTAALSQRDSSIGAYVKEVRPGTIIPDVLNGIS